MTCNQSRVTQTEEKSKTLNSMLPLANEFATAGTGYDRVIGLMAIFFPKLVEDLGADYVLADGAHYSRADLKQSLRRMLNH